MAKSKTEKRGVYLYIDGKEVTNSVQSIEREIRKLTTDIKSMTLGTEEYNRTAAKIRNLKGMLQEHKNEIKNVTAETKKSTISIGKFADGFNRFFGMITAGLAALTGFVLGIRQLREEKNKLEESQAGLKALTGLDDESITWLTAQAKTLSTTMTKEGLRVRQSASEILDAFMLVGSAKPELLGDKEALKQVSEEAMRLQAAAKDISLNQAVDALTLSLNQYGDQADQAARYTNVLAAGSKAGSANIASQAAAIQKAGTAAASANVPIEETVGLIETLAYKGIKDEIAGTGLKKFFLVLQTGADKTNPKIVGLDKALENLRKKNMSAGAIKSMFGEEGFNTASVIINNTEMVKDFTKAVIGTNLAVEQSAINSATAAAKLAQAKNELKLAGIELAERLDPAITVSTNLVTNMIKYLPGVIDWFKEWGGTIVWLSISILSYVAALKLKYLWTQKNVIATKSLAIINGTLKGSLYLLQIAYYTLTGQMSKARGAMVAFNLVTKLNPIAALTSLIIAAAGAFYLLSRKTSAAKEAEERLNKIRNEAIGNIQEEKNRLDNLWKIASDVNVSLDARKEAIKKINKISPEYLGNISLETINTKEAKKAVDDYTDSLVRKATIEAEIQRLAEIDKEMAKYDNKPENYLKENVNAFQLLWNGFTSGSAIPKWDAMVKEKKKLLADVKKLQEIDFFPKKKQQIKPDEEDKKCPICGKYPCECNKGGTPDKDKFAKAETDHYNKISEIKKKYLTDSSITQEDYNKQMEQAELDLLKAKLKVLGLEPDERMKINDQVLDMQVKLKDKLLESEKKQAEEQKKIQEKAYDERMKLLDRQEQDEISKLIDRRMSENMSEQEFNEQLKQIHLDFIDQKLKDIDLSEDDKNKLLRDKQDIQCNEFIDNLDRQKQKQQEMQDFLEGMATTMGTTLGDMFAGNEEGMHDMLKNMLNMVLDYLEKVCIAAVGEVTITSFTNLISAAASIGKILAIKAAFATAKAAIGSFDTGGYTGSGAWNDPKGIVHANEFVSNRYAVANPNIRPVLDLIDVAQRTGNVSNLTADDVAAVVGNRNPSSNLNKAGKYMYSQQGLDPAIASLIYNCTTMMGRIKAKLDEPMLVDARVYATGRYGVNEAQKLVDRMENNVSRKNK